MKIQLENVLVESINHSEVTSKSTGTVYPKAEVIIAESIVTSLGERVEYYPFTFFGEKAALTDQITKGDIVNITGYTKGNMYKGRCYLSINATYVYVVENAKPEPSAKPAPKKASKPKAKATAVEDVQSDELPF